MGEDPLVAPSGINQRGLEDLSVVTTCHKTLAAGIPGNRLWLRETLLLGERESSAATYINGLTGVRLTHVKNLSLGGHILEN